VKSEAGADRGVVAAWFSSEDATGFALVQMAFATLCWRRSSLCSYPGRRWSNIVGVFGKLSTAFAGKAFQPFVKLQRRVL